MNAPELIAKVISYLPRESKLHIVEQFNVEKLPHGGVNLVWRIVLEVQIENSIYIRRHDMDIIKEIDEQGKPAGTYLRNAQESWSVEELSNEETIQNYGLCVQKDHDHEIVIPFIHLKKLIQLVFLINECHYDYDKGSDSNNIFEWVIKEVRAKHPDVKLLLKPKDG